MRDDHNRVIRGDNLGRTRAYGPHFTVLPIHFNPVSGAIRHLIKGNNAGNQAVCVILESKAQRQSQSAKNGHHVFK